MSEEVKLNPSMTEYQNEEGRFIRPILRWDEDHKHVVKVGEEDIQENIDKAAQGMTLSEQLHRLARGDISVLRTAEPYYGDVSEMPEMYGDAAKAYQKVLDEEAARISAEKKAKLEAAQKELEAAQAKVAAAEKENEEVK